MSGWPGVIASYRERIDLPTGAPIITLLEGNTPLIPVPRLAAALGAGSLYVKFEGLNPTGSFKDRGMTVAISQAAHVGVRTVVCASTGNTAASAAAYAARAGLRCLVLIPAGQVASGKLAGAIAYGAEVLQIEGSFDQALDLVRQAADNPTVALVNSINRFRLEGQKTLAFEVVDQLEAAPDWLALPVGNAGNISAIWQGFGQLAGEHKIDPPRLLGVQAAGAAPLVLGHPVADPHTIASAIRIGRPARGEQALEAADQSGGRIVAVEDEAILEAQRWLASEGLWVEPASAAGLAGLRQEVEASRLSLAGSCAVIVCTGHGLKDPAVITDSWPAPQVIPATPEALLSALGSG
jgi:threonine synthase